MKNFAILDKLNSYNILNRQPPSIMHDMIEGTIPLNFYYMMVQFKKDKVMTVATLNSVLSKFVYGRVEMKDGKVPFENFSLNSLNHKSGFKMSATNTWTLSRIFPLIFGGRLRANRHFLNYLDGLKIFRLLMADSFTKRA